jgi:hypothetical protein
MAKKSLPKGARDNRANQINLNNPAYHRARGATARYAEVLAAPPQASSRQPRESAQSQR